MDIVLIGGLWLDGSAWNVVALELERRGHHPWPMTLPGQGDGAPTATLEDQVAAVLAALDEASGPVLVVGHSAACTLAWLAADRRPDRVAGVVMVGGFGRPPGEPYAATFPVVDGVIAFPGWEPFAGELSDDIPAEVKDRIARDAHPVPGDVARAILRFDDQRRYDVPVTIVCPEFTPQEAKDWIDAGNVPELAAASQVGFVDIDSGHWPMFTKPVELARILSDIAVDRSRGPVAIR